jgi:serine/threonine-protein kinase
LNVIESTDSKGKAEIKDVKIADFGMGCRRNSKDALELGEILGTPGYVAPEELLGTSSDLRKGDSWSLGVILFNLVTGQMPF